MLEKEAQIAALGWTNEGCCFTKTFVFKDFKQALQFINSVGVHAEKVQHHPQISNTYNKVTLRLWTHDTGEIGPQDVAWILSFNSGHE